MANDETYRKAFAWFLENETGLRRLVASVLRGRGLERTDEVLSDVILERLPRLVADFRDDGRSSFSHYANANLRWYVFKWAKRQDVHRNNRAQPLNGESETRASCDAEQMHAVFEAADLVGKLRSQLSRDQFRLLSRRYAEELPVDVICGMMGVGRSTYYARMGEAMKRAREVLL